MTFIQLLVRGASVVVNSEHIEAVHEDDDDSMIIKMIGGTTINSEQSIHDLILLLPDHVQLTPNSQSEEDEDSDEEE